MAREAGATMSIKAEKRGSPLKPLWQLLTLICIGLGVLGIVLPLLPTTPFVLVASWSAPNASPTLGRWLQHHPTFGPTLSAWHQNRAVPRRAKWLAPVLMAVSLAWVAYNGAPLWLVAALGGFFSAISVWLLTRPNASNTTPKIANADTKPDDAQ